MKYKLFLFLVIIFFVQAVWSACPDMGKPILNINFKYGKINYINNKSNKDFPQAPYSSVMGLTVTDLQRKASGDNQIQSTKDGGFCVMLQQLNVDIGFPKVDIYIDKKYKPGTCNYNVIKEHENYHARVQQEGLKFFSKKIKEAYQIALSKIKPVETYSKAGAQDAASRMIKQIEQDVAPLMEYVQKRLKEENMVIDTQASYEAESKKCPKW